MKLTSGWFWGKIYEFRSKTQFIRNLIYKMSFVNINVNNAIYQMDPSQIPLREWLDPKIQKLFIDKYGMDYYIRLTYASLVGDPYELNDEDYDNYLKSWEDWYLRKVRTKFNINKMDVEDILKSVDHICLFIAISLFLIIKFLKYLLGRERLKIKRSSSSLYNSINSPSPNSI